MHSGKTIGVAVSGTQNYWDREAFEGAIAEVERQGGTVVTTDGGPDTNVHKYQWFLKRRYGSVDPPRQGRSPPPRGQGQRRDCFVAEHCNRVRLQGQLPAIQPLPLGTPVTFRILRQLLLLGPGT